MSYLDPPRFHFSGRFSANPPTINNATENYNLNEVYNNQPPSNTNPNSVWWNKNGQGFFKITDAVVQSAYLASGPVTGNADSIIGAQLVSVVTGAGNAQFSRLVDLDPDQQARSMIVGMKLQLTLPSEPGVSVSGIVVPMTIIDVWGRVQGGSGGGIFSAGCMYQSVIEELEWTGIAKTGSDVLTQLYAASPDSLSIKFNVDAYDGNSNSNTFTQGRIVGTIGPQFSGEPVHMLAKRRVFGYLGQNSPMNDAPWQLAGTKLVVDLGNSVPTTAILAGPFMNLGPIQAVIDPNGASVVVQPLLVPNIAAYTQAYTQTAGIFEIEIGAANAAKLANKPLGLQISPPQSGALSAVTGVPAGRLKEGLTLKQSGAVPQPAPAKTSIALLEPANGIIGDFAYNALRLEKGATDWDSAPPTGTEITRNARVVFTATQWGQRTAGIPVTVTTAINQYQFVNSEGNPYNINNEPMSAIGVSPPLGTQVQTDGNGEVVFTFTSLGLTGAQKPARRQYLDGQLYLFQHNYTPPTAVQPLTLLVFEDAPAISSPTWWKDVYPILNQYARLYPAMRDLIDLSNYQIVKKQQNLQIISTVLTLPMSHPGYMPVTRDLSMRNRKMILQWITNGTPEGAKPN